MKRDLMKFLAVAVLVIPRASAQESVSEFLKPHTAYMAPIDNFGPTSGSRDNPAVPYTRTCVQSDARHISCRTIVAKIPSGGGRWFGPWYWIASDNAPVGYKYQSGAFHLPARDPLGNLPIYRPDTCDGDDNSPMVACSPEGCGKVHGGNPDDSFMGHRNGTGHHAVCYIVRDRAEAFDGVKWLWNLQGEEGGISAHPWPFTSNGSLIEGESRRDGAISEPAELDVVYVRK